jgi:Peptidase family C25/Propeptide_C25
MRLRTTAVTLLWLLASTFAAGANQNTDPVARPRRPNPNLLQAFDDLLRRLEDIKRGELTHGQKTSLFVKVAAARHHYKKKHVCPSSHLLQSFLDETQRLRLRRRRAALVEELYAGGRSLRDLVILQADRRSSCADASVGRPPKVELLESDNEHLSARVRFGSPKLASVKAGDETWTQMSLPGIENVVGPSGQPSLPSWQALVGIPSGSQLRLPAVQTTVRERIGLNLYPFQQQAADQVRDPRFGEEPPPPDDTFKDPPFLKDDKAYATDAFAPPNPCAVRMLGQMRDLQIAQIECNSARYNPVSDALEVFDAVEFDLKFEGGVGTFLTSQSLSPFEAGSSALASQVLNEAAVRRYVDIKDIGILPCWGEELLILTHHNFRAAADSLATWKSTKGIATSVREVGTGTPYPTGAAIDAFIESRYDSCVVRPSYVLLLGDSEFVPPSRTDWDSTMPDTCSDCGDSTTGSDWGYANYPQFFLDVFPDFGVGRIPVDTQTEAQRVVDKIVQYESSPPFLGIGSGAPYYTTATNASYFQCCRTDVGQAGTDMRSFVETSELTRNVLLGRGYNVERIYTTNTDFQDNFVADPTPRRFFNGTLLPAAIGPGFAWSGNATNVVNAFNAGRFLVFHRDHGGSTSWGDPPFGTGNFGSLTNSNRLPVVYSINCASGNWDRETDGGGSLESFMEQLLMLSGGGMVGGLGDNRNSPTWVNSALSRGFFDATWPETAPGFGSSASIRRIGDILNHGKLYLLTQIGVAQTAGEIVLDGVLGEWIMWHAFGDPTLELWTGNPYRLVLTTEVLVQALPDRLHASYPVDGATLTALQLVRGEPVPVARATVKGGVADLQYFVPPDPRAPIELSASFNNAVSVALKTNPGPPTIN